MIASRDHRTVNVFYSFCCFICQFYTYLHNVIDLNINLYCYFTLLLLKNRSYVILHNKTVIRSVTGHRSLIRQQSISQRSLIRQIVAWIGWNTVPHLISGKTDRQIDIKAVLVNNWSCTVPEPIWATKIVICIQSSIRFQSVIDLQINL